MLGAPVEAVPCTMILQGRFSQELHFVEEKVRRIFHSGRQLTGGKLLRSGGGHTGVRMVMAVGREHCEA